MQTEINKDIYKNKRIVLGIILIGVLMANLDAVMLSIALPTITTYFNVGLSQSQWVVTGYIVAMTCLLIIFGKISEYTGKTKIYIMGFSIFTVSSLICGITTNINELIIFRIVQGMGASMVYGVMGALLYEAYPSEERGRAMGYVATTVAGAILIGPALGGLITDFLGWRYIFFINVPIGIVLVACAVKYMHIPETTLNNLKMDWIGSGTLVISIAFLLLFFGELSNNKILVGSLLIYGAIFAVSLIIFVIWEGKYETPLLDLSIFRNKLFILPTISYMFYYIALNINNIIGPFYFEGAMGYKPSEVGLFFMIVPLIMMFASPVSGWLYDKHHWKYTTGLGMSIVAAAYILQSYAFQKIDLGLIILTFVIAGVGSGIFQGPIYTEILDSLSDKTAIASGIASMSRSLGVALGVSLATILAMFELNAAGYNGAILSAGPSLLSSSIGMVVLVAGILCVISTAMSVLRNM